MAADHYRFSPSGFGRLKQGAGCWILHSLYPDASGPNTAAEEGTAAHEVAHTVALGKPAPAVGSLCSNGIAVTPEMIEGAHLYAEYVHEHGKGVKWYEYSIRIPRLHLTDCGGTPDAFTYQTTTETLHVFDYKFGHGYVEPFENWQLAAYAGGIMTNAALCPFPPKHIVLHIIQPRCYSAQGTTRSWRATPEQIDALCEKIRDRIGEVLNGVADCNTGSQCGNCNARHACTALQRSAAQSMDYSHMSLPDEMPPAAIGVELTMTKAAIQRLEARQSGLEAQALAALEGGARVAGWKVGHGTGREEWTQDATAIAALGDAVGVELRKPLAVVTPSQAKRKLAAVLGETAVSALVERRHGEAKLVEDDINHVRRIFGQQQE